MDRLHLTIIQYLIELKKGVHFNSFEWNRELHCYTDTDQQYKYHTFVILELLIILLICIEAMQYRISLVYVK